MGYFECISNILGKSGAAAYELSRNVWSMLIMIPSVLCQINLSKMVQEYKESRLHLNKYFYQVLPLVILGCLAVLLLTNHVFLFFGLKSAVGKTLFMSVIVSVPIASASLIYANYYTLKDQQIHVLISNLLFVGTGFLLIHFYNYFNTYWLIATTFISYSVQFIYLRIIPLCLKR